MMRTSRGGVKKAINHRDTEGTETSVPSAPLWLTGFAPFAPFAPLHDGANLIACDEAPLE